MKKRFILFILLFVCLFTFSACKNSETKDNAEFEIHTTIQLSYLNGDYNNFSSFADGTKEQSLPEPVILKWGKKLKGGSTVFISEDESFTDALVFKTNDKQIKVYNLKINQKYYWKVEFKNNEKLFVKTFKIISTTPRNLYIDGLTNCRDLGGWKTEDDSYVKQNLIFRTSKFNADESADLLISEAGKKTLIENFKIKTEIDLRKVDDNENGSITTSPLGSSVNYISIPMQSNGNCLILNKEKLKELFVVLGNINNYPIVFHCSIGTDRTGMVAFLLNALLGVKEEDLYRDYLFSNFGNIGRIRTKSAIKNYLDTLYAVSGKTLSEKAYNYLIDIDVDKKDIDNFINILK